MKRFTSILLCLAMLLTLAAPVHATEDEHSTDNTGSTDESQTQETTHTHSYSVISDSADCLTAGKITKECSCGDTQEEDSPAKGHAWNSGTETKAATCMETGVKTFSCTRCTETKTEDIPISTTHSYGAWTNIGKLHSRECTLCKVTDSAEHSGTWTQGDDTNHTKTCDICGSISEAHDWKEETVKPTCKDEGSKKKVCSVCKREKDVQVLAKLKEHTYDSACDEECNVCSAKREINHTFTKIWSHDAKTHWRECTKCGEKKDEDKHLYGPAATEDAPQICLTCDRIIVPRKEHVHSYGEEWSSDEVGHWHACAKCKEEKDYAAHKFDDDCDEDCNVCGYKRKDIHKYADDAWQTTNFEHWNVCTLCGQESKHEKHMPGEEATEKAPQLCTVCGFELAPALDHDHDFGNKWHQTEQTHWQECDCGELSVPEAHVWNEGKKNRNDTITFTCEVCGGEKTEQAPASGISWVLVFLIALALICLAGIVVLVILLKKGAFNETDIDDEDEDELLPPDGFESPEEVPVDDEDKMIDDFFASLGEDLFK